MPAGDKSDGEYGLVSADITPKTAQTEQGTFTYTGTAGVSASALLAGHYFVTCTTAAYIAAHASTAVSATNGCYVPADTLVYVHVAADDYLRAVRVAANGSCYYWRANA